VNALPCVSRWRGGAPRGGSHGQPGTGASRPHSGPERGRLYPTLSPRQPALAPYAGSGIAPWITSEVQLAASSKVSAER